MSWSHSGRPAIGYDYDVTVSPPAPSPAGTELARGGPSSAYAYLGEVFVFFVLILYIFVNLANLLYHVRYHRDRFNWFLNGLVPVIGIGIDAYLIYKSFFVSLWDAGFKTGRSVVLFSLALVAVSILYVLYLKITNPQRLTGSSIDHITTEPEPGIHA